MHDLNGKPLTPFDRVRAASREELDAKGINDPPAGFDGEKIVLTGSAACQTCNVQVVDGVEWPTFLQSQTGGIGMFPYRGSIGYATARTLVKVEG